MLWYTPLILALGRDQVYITSSSPAEATGKPSLKDGKKMCPSFEGHIVILYVDYMNSIAVNIR